MEDFASNFLHHPTTIEGGDNPETPLEGFNGPTITPESTLPTSPTPGISFSNTPNFRVLRPEMSPSVRTLPTRSRPTFSATTVPSTHSAPSRTSWMDNPPETPQEMMLTPLPVNISQLPSW